MITEAQAQTLLAKWLAAEEALTAGQSYSLGTGGPGDRSLTRVAPEVVRERIEYYSRILADYQRARLGVRHSPAAVARLCR